MRSKEERGRLCRHRSSLAYLPLPRRGAWLFSVTRLPGEGTRGWGSTVITATAF